MNKDKILIAAIIAAGLLPGGCKFIDDLGRHPAKTEAASSEGPADAESAARAAAEKAVAEKAAARKKADESSRSSVFPFMGKQEKPPELLSGELTDYEKQKIREMQGETSGTGRAEPGGSADEAARKKWVFGL